MLASIQSFPDVHWSLKNCQEYTHLFTFLNNIITNLPIKKFRIIDKGYLCLLIVEMSLCWHQFGLFQMSTDH
jgi:hypothetical protein